jgi:hypothetical protein
VCEVGRWGRNWREAAENVCHAFGRFGNGVKV